MTDFALFLAEQCQKVNPRLPDGYHLEWSAVRTVHLHKKERPLFQIENEILDNVDQAVWTLRFMIDAYEAGNHARFDELPGIPDHPTPYQERALLLQQLTVYWEDHGIQVWWGEDPQAEEGFRGVLFARLPTGQVSWHISDEDTIRFGHVGVFDPEQHKAWDGHTTKQKYDRLTDWTMVMFNMQNPYPLLDEHPQEASDRIRSVQSDPQVDLVTERESP